MTSSVDEITRDIVIALIPSTQTHFPQNPHYKPDIPANYVASLYKIIRKAVAESTTPP